MNRAGIEPRSPRPLANTTHWANGNLLIIFKGANNDWYYYPLNVPQLFYLLSKIHLFIKFSDFFKILIL